MRKLGNLMCGGLSLALVLAALPSCRKPRDAVKSDLVEAGYQMTAPDLLRAAARNDVPALKKFASGGFPLDSADEAGDSALHAAAAAGAEESADFLLGRGLAVDLPGASGRTPLMAAVLGDRTGMVGWLLRQGADPRLKDEEGFSALLLGVREDRPGAVGELAPYHRDGLDAALLLAALEGRTTVSDTLTNYGASIYSRMEDGRTPLMLAAQNGHSESVELLLDIGAGRFSTDSAGRTAADLANEAGHTEVAALISQENPLRNLVLESPDEIARSMDAFLDAALADAGNPATSSDSAGPSETAVTETAGDGAGGAAATPASPRQVSRPIQGEVLSASRPAVGAGTGPRPDAVAATSSAPDAAAIPPEPGVSASTAAAIPEAALPPLVMRHYQERELPVEVRSVEEGSATLAIRSAEPREVRLQAGDPIPDSRLVVVRVERRIQHSKDNLGRDAEVSVVEVRDESTGTTREWISGVPASAHDPVALVEDAATGRRYTASPGQRFTSADGREFIVSDVRPNQLVIEDAGSGAVRTIPLSGPRG